MIVVPNWFEHIGRPDESGIDAMLYAVVNEKLSSHLGTGDMDVIGHLGLSYPVFYSLVEALGGGSERIVGFLIGYYESGGHAIGLGTCHHNIYSVGMKRKIGIVTEADPTQKWDMHSVNKMLIGYVRLCAALCEALADTTETYYLWDIKYSSRCYSPFLARYIQGWNTGRIVGYALAYGVSVGDLQISEENKFVDLYQSGRQKAGA